MRKLLLVSSCLAALIAMIAPVHAQQVKPVDLANQLIAVLQKGDNQAAATFLAADTRQSFLELSEYTGRLRAARKTFDEVIKARFAATDITPGADAAVERGVASVERAEVVSQEEIGADAVILRIKLHTVNKRDIPLLTWRAVLEGGAWKIILPACATPQMTAPLLARMRQLVTATEETASAARGGMFGSAEDARRELIVAERSALERTSRGAAR